MDWYVAVLKKYAVFDGRARRKEYWMYSLITVLISVGLSIIDQVLGLNKAAGGISPLQTIYGLAVLVPGIAVSVRRLHDTNRSGLWVLVAFIPCVGAILLLIWFIAEGDKGSNQFGPDPKAGERQSADDGYGPR